jgi:4-amino-4-deoxy-L-arabinose transferase-like glycosyltransferase
MQSVPSLPTADAEQRARVPYFVWIIGGLVLLILGVLLWGLNMRRGLNHDEHQFVAAAVLMAREGLTPYVDFPYFHLPLLSQLYALVIPLAESLLLSARTISILSAWATLAILLWLGYDVLAGQRPWLRLLHGAAGAVLLAFTPLFVYTSGRAWNHDLPVLLSVIATILLLTYMDQAGGRSACWRVLLAGLLLGLAIVSRASFAFLVPAFLLGLWLGTPAGYGPRLRAIAWFAVGGVLGALPALILLARDPQAFLFGNLTYVRLNTLYYEMQGGAYPGMTLVGKLGVLGSLLVRQPANALPLLLFGGSAIWAWPRVAPRERAQLLVLGVLLGLALFGALAATPSQTQYFYLLLPLAVLGSLHAVGVGPRAQQRWGVIATACTALLALLLTGSAYLPGLAIVAKPDEWVPRKVHARGELIAELVGDDQPVLTLSPTHVLEGNLPIYSVFATGPFAWRIADLVDEEMRLTHGLVGPNELAELLAGPPRALLTGLDNDDSEEEAPLVDYALTQRYLPVALPDDGMLWLSPLADWDGVVQLGATRMPKAPLWPGDGTVISLYLQALEPMAQDFNLQVRLVNAAGEEVWRADGWPYGAPTSQWPAGEVRADGYTVAIPESASPGLYKLEATLYDPATLDPVGEPVTAGVLRVGDPPMIEAAQAQLGERITLHDTHVAADADGIVVELVWQADGPLPAGLARFVQVLDADGQVIAQQDGAVMNDFLPTQHWPSKWPILDQVTLDTSPGAYTVIAGFYDPQTMTRLPVRVLGEGAGDFVVVGETGE